jgi:hypothetical protein
MYSYTVVHFPKPFREVGFIEFFGQEFGALKRRFTVVHGASNNWSMIKILSRRWEVFTVAKACAESDISLSSDLGTGTLLSNSADDEASLASLSATMDTSLQ